MKSFVISLLVGLIGSFVKPVYAQENTTDYNNCLNMLPENLRKYLRPKPAAGMGAKVTMPSGIGAQPEIIEFTGDQSIIRIFLENGEISTLQVGSSSSGPWTGKDYRFWFLSDNGQKVCVPARIQKRKPDGPDKAQDDGEPLFDLVREQTLCRGFETFQARNPWVNFCTRFQLPRPVSNEEFASLTVDESNFIFLEKAPEKKDGNSVFYKTRPVVVKEARKKCFSRDTNGIPAHFLKSPPKTEQMSDEPLSPQYRWAQYYLEKCGLDYVKGAIADWETLGPKKKVGPLGQVK